MTALASAAGTLLAALAATGALWFTGQSLRATNTQLGTSQQTAVTDRLQQAAEQLSSDKIDVRIAGVYLFERLARDSPADHATVYSVLAAFVRTQAPGTDCATPPDAAPPVDIQVAITVIGRRNTSREGQPADKMDLSRTCLADVDLTDADLHDANLRGTNLRGANLIGADLANANLRDTNLSITDLFETDLAGAGLYDANLTGADLANASLHYAGLYGANLTGANLAGADLDNANLDDMRYDQATKWPKGFTPPPLPR